MRPGGNRQLFTVSWSICAGRRRNVLQKNVQTMKLRLKSELLDARTPITGIFKKIWKFANIWAIYGTRANLEFSQMRHALGEAFLALDRSGEKGGQPEQPPSNLVFPLAIHFQSSEGREEINFITVEIGYAGHLMKCLTLITSFKKSEKRPNWIISDFNIR